ncbi:MAG: response regulator [Planctomycetota bacterium]
MGKPLKLLLVEDSEDDALILLRELRRGGYEPAYTRVDTPENMSAALEREKWDLVISDYNMPRFNGLEALKTLQSKKIDIPFIIVSGAIGENMAVALMKAGAHDYIMKSQMARLIPAIDREIKDAAERAQRRKTEEEKIQLQAQLIQAQKIESIGNLAGGVAHDFNNLLNIINGYCELAMMDLDKNHPVYNNLQEIVDAAERASNLTRQLLIFSRRQPMEFKLIGVNQAIEDLLKMMKRLIGENIKIKPVFESKTDLARLDAGGIGQVIMNLVVNARDAMPNGGTITIKTEDVILGLEDCKSNSEARPGKFIRVSVQDNGMGIARENINRIFEPFFTTKPAGKGTGLGLPVVFGVVKQHDGWINVSSELQKGTTFEVYLPVSGGEIPSEIDGKIAETKLFSGKNERILVVEDEEKNLNLVLDVLAKNGYTVFGATDAVKAMDIFEREKGDFRLVFSDMVLPDMNALQLIDKMRLQKPDLTVLLSSGYIDEQSCFHQIQDKKYPFLQKPYSMGSLLETIKTLITQRPESC